MSLEVGKLEKVRELPGGITQARCPACAEGGHDRTGEHLRIYPDGRFGCCVHPKDKAHRKRIFALAGGKLPSWGTGTFTVRLKAPSASPSSRSVKAALSSPACNIPETESGNGVRAVRDFSDPDSRTPRTGIAELRARARVDAPVAPDAGEDFPEQLKDSETCVRDVRTGDLPYLAGDETLVIPFESPEHFHWWKPDGERLPILETLREVKERRKNAVVV